MYIIYDDRYLEHKNGPGHPENPGRLRAIMGMLKGQHLIEKKDIELIAPYKAKTKDIELIHDPVYIEKVRQLSTRGYMAYLDPDTALSEKSYDCALLAAGGCMKGIDMICGKEDENSCFYAIVRPPGHHAFRDRGSGFCIFNNVAIACRYAQKKHPVKKTVILDFDAHHGNATQDAFYEDGDVLYISFHQYPHYPGSGSPDEIGRGSGKYRTLNFAFRQGASRHEYIHACRSVVLPLILRFKPSLMLISAGYDSHQQDPLSSLGLKEKDYYDISILAVFSCLMTSCRNIGVVLEGGYDHSSTARSVISTIEALNLFSVDENRVKREAKRLLALDIPESGSFSSNNEIIENIKKVFL